MQAKGKRKLKRETAFMERGVPRRDYALLAAGVAVLLAMLAGRDTPGAPRYLQTVHQAAVALKGQVPYSDIATDIVGFRAMVEKRDAYPVLGPALRDMGMAWDIRHVSTHPPTAYVLVAPIAYLPWRWASAGWAWLMLALLGLSFYFCGLRPLVALGLTPIALLWPPVATSLGQTTILWLFGLAWAYAWLRERPFWSGVGIGLAALTKLVPGVMILLCCRKRLWRAVPGLAVPWVAALGAVLWLAPDALARYAEVNRTNAVETMLRVDNSALLATGFRAGGWAGVACVMLFLILILSVNRDCLFRAPEPVPSTRLWMLGSYVAVALLPIAWVYSLTPLLPVIMYLLLKGTKATTGAGMVAIAMPCLCAPWGVDSVAPLVTANVAVGVGLMAAGRPAALPRAPSSEACRGPDDRSAVPSCS
jgi:hypothetical protein